MLNKTVNILKDIGVNWMDRRLIKEQAMYKSVIEWIICKTNFTLLA